MKFLNFIEYNDLFKITEGVTGFILFEFANNVGIKKNTIIRNFIARSFTSLKGVFNLWEAKAYQDCWSINRCLIDRLFHLHYLAQTDSYEDFEKYSFIRQYETLNKINSDKEFKNKLGDEYIKNLKDNRIKYNEYKSENIRWARPNAEDMAKDMDLDFLYRYGYDYASMHIHPMANDGEEDFYNFTGLEPRPNFTNQIVVIHNSILIMTLILQEGLNTSDLLWRSILYNTIDSIRRSLNGLDGKLLVNYTNVGKMFHNKIPLCKLKE